MRLLKKFLAEYEIGNEETYNKFSLLNSIILEWNSKVNVISRKNTSIENIVINSLYFLVGFNFHERAKILDIGTGGGFPGIPLKIVYPEVEITLCDSIQKKIKVVEDIIERMELSEAKTVCSRAEELEKDILHARQYDYIVSKSVAPVKDLYKWGNGLLKRGGMFLCIKGGDIKQEIAYARKKYREAEFEERIYTYPREFNIEDKKLVIIKQRTK